MRLNTFTIALILLLLAAPLLAKERFPETTSDGLKLQHQTNHGALYIKEGASLAGYSRISILDCFVQFRENWQRDFNRSQLGVDHQITDRDVEQIKEQVATEFPKAFSKVLESRGYEIVDNTGKDVLLLRPAVIDLTVTSPNTNTAGWSAKAVQSNGTMTLYMEIYDAANNTKIAQIIDGEIVGSESFAHRGGAVRNNAQFAQTMERWANALSDHLDNANGKDPG